MVVFSENTVYGFKNQFNKKITQKMISDLKTSNAHQRHAFIFNFFGFNDINNIVSVYYYKDNLLINQKKHLFLLLNNNGSFLISMTILMNICRLGKISLTNI